MMVKLSGTYKHVNNTAVTCVQRAVNLSPVSSHTTVTGTSSVRVIFDTVTSLFAAVVCLMTVGVLLRGFLFGCRLLRCLPSGRSRPDRLPLRFVFSSAASAGSKSCSRFITATETMTAEATIRTHPITMAISASVDRSDDETQRQSVYSTASSWTL